MKRACQTAGTKGRSLHRASHLPPPPWMRLAGGTFILLGILCWTAPSLAHRAFAPRQVNRYAVLTVSSRKLGIEYLVYFGALPGMRIRARWDHDKDGTLTADEIRLGALALGRRLAASLVVQLDGKPLPTGSRLHTSWDLLTDTRVRPSPLTLRLKGDYSLPDHTMHKLLFDDKAADSKDTRPVGEIHVEVHQDPEVRLLECHTGTWASGIRKKFSFMGRASSIEDRRIVVLWADLNRKGTMKTGKRTPAASRSNSAVAALLAVALLGLIGLATTWYWLRRRQERTNRSSES